MITSGENIEIRLFFILMKSDFQDGPPDDHHFLLKVPKVTVGIFISSSPGTSRAGGNPNSLSINLLHAVLFPYQLIPPSLLTDEYFIAWTRDEHSPVSFTSPGRSSRSWRHWSSTRWERWTWTILRGVVAAMTTGSGNMILAFLNKDIILGAKQLLWTGRVSDVHRRNRNISCAIRWLRFLNSITQKDMTFHLVK